MIVEGPGFHHDAWSDTDGGFRVDGLPAGTWTLRAELKLHGAAWSADVHVEAGATGVDVTLAPP